MATLSLPFPQVFPTLLSLQHSTLICLRLGLSLRDDLLVKLELVHAVEELLARQDPTLSLLAHASDCSGAVGFAV